MIGARYQVPPLFGLVLAGGRSTRMGADKAALCYRGETQLDSSLRLLRPWCARIYCSIRPEQASRPPYSWVAQIHDRFDAGPLGGVLCAMEAYPDASWLVIACDLPYLEPATVHDLVLARNARRPVTAFLRDDGQPEPLCAIYEPMSQVFLAVEFHSGRGSLRASLGRANANLLTLAERWRLESVNCPEERDVARRKLEGEAAG